MIVKFGKIRAQCGSCEFRYMTDRTFDLKEEAFEFCLRQHDATVPCINRKLQVSYAHVMEESGAPDSEPSLLSSAEAAQQVATRLFAEGKSGRVSEGNRVTFDRSGTAELSDSECGWKAEQAAPESWRLAEARRLAELKQAAGEPTLEMEEE